MRNTIGPRRAASALTAPSALAPGTVWTQAIDGLLCALLAARADHNRLAGAGEAHRQPPAEGSGAAEDGDRLRHAGAAYAPPDETRGKTGTGHRRRKRNRGGDLSPARRRGRGGGDRRREPRGRAGGGGGDRRRGQGPRRHGRDGRRRGRRLRGAVRDPGQQRRHGRLRVLHGHDPRALAASAGDQPRGRVRVHARRAARDAGGGQRANREHRLRGGPGRLEGVGRVFRREGGRDRLHEDDRPRERAIRDHGKRDRARGRSTRRS